ncbi:MAG: thiol peroxidase [Nitrospirales bacterium]
MLTKRFMWIMLIFTTTALVGCTGLGRHSDQAFTYKDIQIDTTSASTGEGSTIQFKGNPLPLSGRSIQVGDSLRSVNLAKGDLSLIDVTDTAGSVRLINVVPSLDTTVCEQQTHYLSEKNQGLDQQVELITISVDTPFAQDRFAKEAGINNVKFLSDFRGGEFGKTHGLLLEGPHVLARAVLVVDGHNVVRHLQVTPDLGHMPDMEKAFQVARSLVKEKG